MMKMDRSATSGMIAAVDGFIGGVARGSGIHENGTVSRIARGSMSALVVYSVGILLTYCSQLVIARFIGVAAYGVYSYVFSWMMILAYFSTLGFDVALLRFVPAYEVERAWSLLLGVAQYAQRRATAVGIAVALLGIVAVAGSGAASDVRYTFLIGFMLVPILALVRIRCALVRAFGGVASSLAPDRIARDGILIGLIAIAAWGWGWAINAPFVMIATLVSSAVGLAGTVLTMSRRWPREIRIVSPTYDAPTWRRAALPLVIAGATEVLMNRTGVILLGWIGDTKSAGIYSLAFNIALVVTVPRIAVNTLFAPTISSLYVRKDQETMQTLVTRAASWTFCAGFFIALALFIAADPLLAWFGSGFEAGVPALRILLVSQLIVAGAGSQLYVMTMTGHERSAAVLLTSITAANIVISVALIKPFGLIGAAMATAATLTVWNAAMSFFLWRRLHLLPGVLATFRFRNRP
jgi:O-antigen/teichoic acid export membrane protein